MVKAYDLKLKRHGFPVLAVYAPNGIEGGEILSASQDQCIRGEQYFANRQISVVWKHDSNKYQQVNKLHLVRPSEKELAPHIQRVGKLVNYAESHCLNTAKALQKVGQNKDVSAFCFTGSSVVQLFSGFDDGLILNYEFSLDKSEKTSTGFKAFIGHMNKINSLIF